MFKGKRIDPELQAIKGVEVRANERAYMSKKLVSDWLSTVVGSFAFNHRILVWDTFSAHRVSLIRDQLKKSKITRIYVPAGCTGIVQPADVSWNVSF